MPNLEKLSLIGLKILQAKWEVHYQNYVSRSDLEGFARAEKILTKINEQIKNYELKKQIN